MTLRSLNPAISHMVYIVLLCEVSSFHWLGWNSTLWSCVYIVVDITAYHRGFHGDLNETLFVGNVDEDSKKLVRIAHECLYKAIAMGMYGSNVIGCFCVLFSHKKILSQSFYDWQNWVDRPALDDVLLKFHAAAMRWVHRFGSLNSINGSFER